MLTRKADYMQLAEVVKRAVLAVLITTLCPGGCSRATAKNVEEEITIAKSRLSEVQRTVFEAVQQAQKIRMDEIKIGSFLGFETRCFYGKGPVPQKLNLIWRVRIGSGQTSGKGGTVTWSGTGWTGQPTLVQHNRKLYLLIGGYDHNLRKIEYSTGKVVWKYDMNDVIKGTNTVFINPRPQGKDDKIVVLSGARRGLGKGIGDPSIASYRAISFTTGKELWRLPIPKTRCYSRDVDSSGLVLDDGLLYHAIEPGYFYIIDPNKTGSWGQYRKPKILKSDLLYTAGDVATHGNNLVVEGSPTLYKDRLYVSTGSGHVYGIGRKSGQIEWDFRIGADLEGTSPVTKDGYLLVTVEKQYIPGRGGVFKLNPNKSPNNSVVWYFPVGTRGIAEWEGGVVGSATINDEYNPDGKKPALAAFNSVDGYVYLVSQDNLASGKVNGPNNRRQYPTPVLIWKDYIGGAISTPIIVDDYIIAGGYGARLHLYKINYSLAEKSESKDGIVVKSRDGKKWKVTVAELDSYAVGSSIESTPIVWEGRVFVGSRDGWFYCLGEK